MILKSEPKTKDMVLILEELYSYVPTTSVEHSIEVLGQDQSFSVIADDLHYTFLVSVLQLCTFVGALYVRPVA